MERVLTSKQKSLEINLNDKIYGTFAEIGAGQETVRNFFRAGGASGTIAKAMSAYDKQFSDTIYGREKDNRYVTESRLKNMLKYEVGLIEERLSRTIHPDKCFFAYANTVATIDFSTRFKGHGWVGIQFQLDPSEGYNEVVLHIRFKEMDAKFQQETLGVLGVNLIYGCFYINDPVKMLLSLYDNMEGERMEIDMINFSGCRFENVDNRLMSLQLLKNKMTDAVIFGPDGNNILPAQLLYKKNILTMRGSFRPVTKVNMDMLETSYKAFCEAREVDRDNVQILFEITLSNLTSSDKNIDERDFLDRANILCSLGYTVLISDFSEYYKLVDYFSTITKARLGLIMGINNLLHIFNDVYYKELSGGILEAFGKLFARDLKIYLYPLQREDGVTINSTNLRVHPRLKELYKHFKFTKHITDIKNANKDISHINSSKILSMISNNEKGWEDMVPKKVHDIITKLKLFGYKNG
ncbi:nicotinate-nucleotide adenylyltransferase [Ichthyobacterium seriolicida]|uniref:Nicotinamide mononucleotide adenylyltransferase n=1 Tax=Ichthyobacterium seriolicida TaxID=242600 RepID=A0A1J1E1Q1_9FLAO|nr:nicotinate-nucleotide adenylyltransferase [Ichthyobacterium seriolicida]BAV94877.1 nicotinamide mononucleotide adenylyltransferase [Ichthyobacterium seriolicida]